MTITKDEAASALSEISAVHHRSATLKNYRYAAPHMMIWGVVWLVANSLSDVYAAQIGRIWPILSFIGGIASFTLGSRMQAQRLGPGGSIGTIARADHGWRSGLTAVVVFAYFSACFAVLPPTSSVQGVAIISLFFTFAYMVFGAWAGLRVFLVGMIASAAILYGYFGVVVHQFLWIGVFAGGALIMGGLWVRKI